MKVLDRYIVRELLLPIIHCTVALIFLLVVADLFDNLDEMIRNNTPFRAILRFYFSLLPYLFTQIIPWSTWLGTLYLLVNFGFHNEIMAMKAAGLKITTIIKPIVFLGFLIGIVTFLVNDRIVPRAFRTASELKEIYIERKKDKNVQKVLRNVTYSSKDRLYYFRTFSKADQEITGVIALWLSDGDYPRRQKMVAKSGRWTGSSWLLEGVTEYKMDSHGRILGEPKTYPKKTYPEMSFTPAELDMASLETNFLTYRELKHSIDKLRESGVRVISENVDLQYRLAAPWQGLVMMLMTVPLVARTPNRKVIALNVLICVGLVFSYHVVEAVGLALGKAGKIFAFFGAWAGNMAFALGAFLNLEKANY